MSADAVPVQLSVGRTSEIVGWVDGNREFGQVVADVAELLRETATDLERSYQQQAGDTP